ncbi:MAG: RagB/SusD family nutrient uptake outer membrane protein [Gemmatimonadaceae bacterium]
MKNMKRLFAPLSLAFMLAGCSDILTEKPANFLTTGSFYKTAADIESATLSTYQPIQRHDVWEWWMVLDNELASDEVRIHPDEPNFTTYLPGLFLWTATSEATVSPWNGFYTTIFRANLVLDRAPAVPFSDATYQKQLIAEAKFLRAYAYLNLTKLYDDVPLLTSIADHQAAATKGRTPVDAVHQQVAKDLNEAIADLPVKPRANGRASKAAARMVLADLYQWRSSFLRKNEWQLMSDAAKSVVDDANWGLVDNYISQFLPTNKGNKEYVWTVPSSGTEGRTSANVFCMWLPRALGFGSAGGCEVIGQPTDWMYKSFASGDYRFQEIYRTYGISANNGLNVDSACAPGVGKCVNFKWPNINKYRPTNRGIGGPTDVDFPIYRYAEALLMYAEAQFELGNVAVATTYVNQVRARARKGTGTETRAEPADLATVTRDDIYMERVWELAHEGKRWFDQVRRNSLEPAVTDPAVPGASGYWEVSMRLHDFESRADYSHFRMRFPIPTREIELNPNLKQNLGY